MEAFPNKSLFKRVYLSSDNYNSSLQWLNIDQCAYVCTCFFRIFDTEYVFTSWTFRYICTHGVSLIGMLSYLSLKSCRSQCGGRDLTLTSRWSCLPCSALRQATMSPLSNTDPQTRPGCSLIVWLTATVQRTYKPFLCYCCCFFSIELSLIFESQ